MFHLSQLAGCLAVLSVVYYIIRQIDLARRRAAFIAEKGCKPVAQMPQNERVLGFQRFLEIASSFKAGTFLEDLNKTHEKLGSTTFSFTSLGTHFIATTEPENLKTIQAIDSKKWTLGVRRRTNFRMFMGIGIFSSDGQEWAHSREMLRPNFVRSQVGDLVTFETHVKALIRRVETIASEVNLSELFFNLTIDSATEFLFGESTETLCKSSSDGFPGAFNRCQDFIAQRTRLGVFARLFPSGKQFEADRKYVEDFIDYYVDKGLSRRSQLLKEKDRKADRYVFIDELIRQTSDRIRIRSELLNILLAGRDTTASLLTNVWWILSQRPDIWAKLQDEVATLDGSMPTFEELKELKYLKALLNESLRLHPVVPVNSRQTIEDTTLPRGGGPDGLSPIFVPKGGIVNWSLYTMHRRKDYYGNDADEFKPERWLDDPDTGRKGLRPGWEYLPFNGGPRICLGQQFALTEASYTTVRLCQAFKEIRSCDEDPWVEGLHLTCVNKNGAKVQLTPR